MVSYINNKLYKVNALVYSWLKWAKIKHDVQVSYIEKDIGVGVSCFFVSYSRDNAANCFDISFIQ